MAKRSKRKAAGTKPAAKKPAARQRGSAALMREVLETTTRFEVAVRERLGPDFAADTAAVASPVLTFIAAVSHTGPWELRGVVVNQHQILDKTIATSEQQIRVPIPPVLTPPLLISWTILAGHLIPTVSTFMAPLPSPPGVPVQLATKQPLKKGESWAALKPSPFPAP